MLLTRWQVPGADCIKELLDAPDQVPGTLGAAEVDGTCPRMTRTEEKEERYLH
jgi:hypothetical protein